MRDLVAAAGIVLLASVAGAAAQSAPVGDPTAGEKTAKICKTCHQSGEGAKNAIGPVLNGVVGRRAGTYPDYNYSDANRNSGLTWDEATLTVYLW